MGAPGRRAGLINNTLLHKDKLLDQIPRKLQYGLILIHGPAADRHPAAVLSVHCPAV